MSRDDGPLRKRKGDLEVGSSTCRLCMQGREDPTHFMSTCPALELKRKKLLENLPPALKSLALIPDPARDPIEFTATLLGIPWIEDTALQEFPLISSLNSKQYGQKSC